MPEWLPSRPEDRRCPDDDRSAVVLSIHRAIGELTLRGELDMAAAPKLNALIDEQVNGRPLVMDLADLTFVDSSGALCMVHAWEKTGRPVVLRNPRRNVLRFLELFGDKFGSTAWVIESSD